MISGKRLGSKSETVSGRLIKGRTGAVSDKRASANPAKGLCQRDMLLRQGNYAGGKSGAGFREAAFTTRKKRFHLLHPATNRCSRIMLAKTPMTAMPVSQLNPLISPSQRG